MSEEEEGGGGEEGGGRERREGKEGGEGGRGGGNGGKMGSERGEGKGGARGFKIYACHLSSPPYIILCVRQGRVICVCLTISMLVSLPVCPEKPLKLVI